MMRRLLFFLVFCWAFFSVGDLLAQVCVGGCNDFNPCTADACVGGTTGGSGTCSHTPRPAGTVCRPAAAGALCDVAETCDGTSAPCPANGFRTAGTICRAAAGVCDVAETCNGTSASCPSNVRQPAGTACTADSNACTLDICNGTSSICTHPAGNAGITCRAAAGVCDIAETCNGTSTSCPSNVRQPAGTACTADSNACTLDICNGTSSSCTHPAGNAGTTCRAAVGVCDVADTCSGTSTSCPNARQPAGTACTADSNACTLDICNGTSSICTHPAGNAGTTCRAAVGVCDVAETCNGTSTSCPGNVGQPAGTACTDDGNLCTDDTCQGRPSTCRHRADDTNSCSDSNACNGAEVCRSGTCSVGDPLVCSDSSSCTIDSCNPTTGCVHTDASCGNGDGCCPEFCTASSDDDCPIECGDGVVSSGEECDDGNDNNTDACLRGCIPASCGDGYVQVGVEGCDEGPMNSDGPGATCRTNCQPAGCGDGITDPDEECDDGNATDGDGCNLSCLIEEGCTPPPSISCTGPEDPWTQVNGIGPVGFSYFGASIAVDPSGNVYTLTQEGSGTSILRQLNTCGETVWEILMEDFSISSHGDIAVDDCGHSYVTAYRSASVSANEATVRKYNFSGSLIWEATFDAPVTVPSTAGPSGEAVAVDTLGNIYVVGTMRMEEGDVSLGEGIDLILRKYDEAGVFQWQQTVNGSADRADYGTSVALDSEGNVYVSGYVTELRPEGPPNLIKFWLGRFNPAGTLEWSFVDDEGSLSSGRFGPKIAVGPDGIVYVPNPNKRSLAPLVILSRFSSVDGSPLASLDYAAVGSMQRRSTALAINTTGNIFVTGYESLDPPLSTNDSRAALVSQLSGDGSIIWDNTTSPNPDIALHPFDIAVDYLGNVFIIGMLYDASPPISFSSVLIRKYTPLGESDGWTGP